jgi:hypothetical protein
LEELRKVVADAIRRKGYMTILGNKAYTAEELAREVEAGTEVGNKIIEWVVRGTLERYAQGKTLSPQ